LLCSLQQQHGEWPYALLTEKLGVWNDWKNYISGSIG
jgi:hypothetical protein